MSLRSAALGTLALAGLLACAPLAAATEPTPPTGGVAWLPLSLGLMGGFVLFLLGVGQLSEAFGEIGDERIKLWIDRFTVNAFTGVLTGAVVCTILDSSSATIILLIAMIRGGLLSFEQSLGIVMGANIGTTLGAQIIALDVFEYAPILLFVGFLLSLAPEGTRWKTIGVGLTGAGLVFFGLDHIEQSVLPLREAPQLLSWFESLGQTPVYGALAGCFATVVIQSSSATVGIAIVMAKAGVLPLQAGVAIMLGAEIGTVSNTFIASLGRGREALRCALFHLFFNLTTVVGGLLLIDLLIRAAGLLVPASDDDAIRTARAIANAQVLFNVAGVALFLPFVSRISRVLYRLVPERPEADAEGPIGIR